MSLSWQVFMPVLALSGFAFLLFTVDALWPRDPVLVRRVSFSLAVIGIAVAAIRVPLAVPEPFFVFAEGMLRWDALAQGVIAFGLLASFWVVLISQGYRGFTGRRLAVYYGLLLLSTVGVMLIAMANDMLMLFIAIELFAVPSVVLTGYLPRQQRCAEAGLKFLLISAFSSAMMIYGMSVVYGLVGSTSLTVMHQETGLLETQRGLANLAFSLILVGLGFKIAVVPFHLWLPDVFEGAPTPVAAFLSIAPKVAGAAAAIRIFLPTSGQESAGLIAILAGLAALTITVGNLYGLRQTNVIRLLAYSSIAHMGYLLLGLVAGATVGLAGFYAYAFVYLAMNVGLFAVVATVYNADLSTDLSAFNGLAKRSPALAGLSTIFLVSLAGLPPTAGFIGKYTVLSAVFQSGWRYLAVIGALNSVIAAAYYFKIIRAMYFVEPHSDRSFRLGAAARLTLVLTGSITLAVGFMPHILLHRIQRQAASSTTILERSHDH